MSSTVDVFAKYLRFFISDKAIKEFFGNEQQRIYSTVNLNDFLSLENFLMSDLDQPNLFLYPMNSIRQHNSTTFKNFAVQKFSLPPTIMGYMLKAASPQQLNALYETCKHIFMLQKSPICCNLTVQNYSSFDENNDKSPCFKQSFKFSRFLPAEFANIFLVKSLTIEASKPATMLSSIIPKLSRCEIHTLNVRGQTVSWNDLCYILKSGNIEKFIFTDGYITMGYCQTVTIEDIIQMIPKAHTIHIDSAMFTINTFTRLAAMDRLAKFKKFTIERINENFKFFDFQYFIFKHSAPLCEYSFVFESYTSKDFIKKFTALVKTMFNDWIPREKKPNICIRKRFK